MTGIYFYKSQVMIRDFQFITANQFIYDNAGYIDGCSKFTEPTEYLALVPINMPILESMTLLDQAALKKKLIFIKALSKAGTLFVRRCSIIAAFSFPDFAIAL